MKFSGREKYLLFLCVVLLLFNALLLHQNRMLKDVKSPSSTVPAIVRKSIKHILQREHHIYTLQGQEVVFEKILNSRYVALIFFSEYDCPMCLEERRYWNKLTIFDSVSVFGIVRAEQPSEELKLWLENLGLAFPVYYDKRGHVTDLMLKEFSLEATPIKLLITDNGEALTVQGPETDYYRQEGWFLHVVEELLRRKL